MPSVFKAVATVSAWILFIGGCISILTTSINWMVHVGFIGEPPTAAFMGWGLGAVDLILAVCAIKLRQMLE